MTPRRTKIVATLGPASSDEKTLTRMIEAGMDVVRMNFSHGTADEHRARVEMIRMLARRAGRAVGVLVDLQGPKIRISRFQQGKVQLQRGNEFVLSRHHPEHAGQQEQLPRAQPGVSRGRGAHRRAVAAVRRRPRRRPSPAP